MHAFTVVCCLLVASAFSVTAGEPEEPEYEMTTFQLVLLSRDQDRREDDAPVAEARAERISRSQAGFLSDLLRSETALIAGDVEGQGRLETVAVLTVGSLDRAREILENAPAVATGDLDAEVYTWWAAKEILRTAPDADDRTDCYLGLLKRPAGAPQFTDERLAEIQRGHLANIGAMAASGDLVIAGPVEDGGDFRGILVFRTTDRDRIEKLVAEDPAIVAGRLELELYRWRVPRGSLPKP
jgi:uncharacterized protein YciI